MPTPTAPPDPLLLGFENPRPVRCRNLFDLTRLGAVFLAVLLIFARPSSAQVYQYYWKDNAGNGRWDWGSSQWYGTETNSNVGKPTYSGGAQLYFENTGGQTTYINAGAASGNFVPINSIFAAANSSGRTYTISTENGIAGVDIFSKIETISGGGALTFNSGAAVRLAANAEINAVGGTLTLNNLNINGYTLNSFGGSTLNINGVISGTGTYNIKNQGLDVTYSGSGANTFSGSTVVENTSLLILNKSANTNAIAGQLTINSGATVRTDATNQLGNNLVIVNGTLNLNNQAQSLALQGSGSVTLGSADLTINMTGSDSFSGNISGTGNVIKSGTGSQTFSGTNGYSGSTTISGGTLIITSDGALGAVPGSPTAGKISIGSATLALNGVGMTLNANRGMTLTGAAALDDYGHSVTYNGIIASSGSPSLNKLGGGTLTLGGTNTYTGTTTVSSGNLSITNASALGANGASNGTNVLNGSALRLSGGIAVGNELLTINGTGFSDGGVLRSVSGANSWAGAITLDSNARINTDADTFAISGTVGAGTNTLYIGGSGSTTISGSLSGTKNTGDGALFKNGSGTLTLSATNSGLTGTTLLRAGTLSVSTTSSLGSGTIEMGDGSTVSTLAITGGGNYERTGGIAIVNNSNNSSISITSGTTYMNGTLSQSGGTTNTTKYGKSGAGTLYLGAANTYHGQVQIGEGNLILGNNTAHGVNENTGARAIDLGLNVGDVSQANNVGVYLVNGITSNASIYVAQNTSSATRTIGLSGSGSGTFSNEIRLDGSAILTGGSGTATFSGAFTNEAALGQLGGLTIGGGTVILTSASSNYTAATNINSGAILQLGSGGTTGWVGSTSGISNNGTLVYNRSNDESTALVITGSGALTKNGTGTLTLSGSNTYTGATTVNAGTLALGAADRISNSSAVTISGGVLNLSSFNDSVASLTLTSGTLAGTGTLTGSTYALQGGNINALLGTGAISVTSGTTTLGSAGRLNASSTLAIDSGQLTLGGAESVSSFTLAGGTLGGSGQTLTASTYALQGGTVSANLGTGTATVTTGTTTLSGTLGSTTVNVNSGNLTLGAADRLADGATVTVAGGILNSGANADTVTTLNLSSGSILGSGTLTATTYGLSGGTMGGALGAGTANVSGAVSLTGTMNPTTLNITSGGNLSLGSSDRIGTGAVDVNAGTLFMGGFNDTVGAVTLRGNGTIGGTGTLTGSSYALQNGTVSANLGTGTATVTSGLTTLSGTLGSTTVNVNSGNLTLGAADRLANGATVSVAGGILNSGAHADTITTLNLSSGSIHGSGTLTATNYELSGGTMGGALGAGTANITNTVSLTGTMASTTLNILNTGNLSLGAASRISDSTNVAISSGGVLTLNTHSDTIATLSGAGNIALGSGTLTATSASDSTFSGSMSGTGAFAKGGAGILTLSGSSNHSGGTTLSAGTLRLQNANALGSGTFTQSSGASLAQFNLAAANFSNAMSLFNVAALENTTLSGSITVNNATFDVESGDTLTLSGGVGGSGGVTKNGTGTLILSGSNNYSGATQVNAGILAISNNNALGSTAAGTTVASGAALETSGGISVGAETLSLTGTGISSGGALRNTSGTNSFAGAITLAGATRINSDSGTLTLTGGISGTQNLTLGGAGDTTIGSAIATSTGTLTKDGAGTLTLSGANTYTGLTTVSGGTLTLSGGSAIADNGAVTMANATSTVLNVNGSETIGVLSGGGTLGGNISIAASQTLTVNQTSTGTFSGIIGGAGGLTKNGSSTLTLSGANSYTGATTINAGTLSLGADNVIGDSSAVTMTGGAFDLGARAETLHSLNMSGGTLSRGGGILTLNNASSITGGTVILSNQASSRINTTGLLTLGTASMNYTASSVSDTNNALVLGGDIAVNSSTTFDFIDSGGNTGNPRINLNNANRVFDVGSSANLNVGWDIWSSTPSSGLLTKNGTGTLTLNGTGTYSGATTINAGTLVLNGTNTSSPITINSGTLAGTGSGGATIVAANGRISPGGSSVGTLATSTLTLNGTGGYIWNISDAAGSAGTGWDLINVGGGTGAATINANSDSKFTIFVNGTPSNFTNTNSYTWNIIDWGTATGFSADAFNVDRSNFTGADPSATWTLANNSGFLQLLYTYATGTPVYSIGTGTWSGNFTPALTNTSDAIFAGAGGTATNNIPSATINTLGTITFNSTAGAYTLAADSGSAGHSATPLTLTGSIVNNSTANQTVNLAMTFGATRVVDTASGNIAIGGVIDGAGGLTKNGSSTLTLTQSNTFTGPIQVNAGTLATTGSGAFANTANITVASGATYNVGVSDQINSLSSPGNLVLSAGTLTVCGTASSSISGAISGSGGLTKGGSGTLTLSNNNSGYSGETRLEGGVLEIGNDGALGTGTVTFRDAGTIRSTDAIDRTLSLGIGTFTGSNNTVYTFGSVGTGNLTFSGTGSTALGSVTRDLRILNNTVTFGQSFTGTGAITKSGAGTMILTGNSTYGGTTTISAGTLQLGAAGGTGNLTSPSIVNNSALVVDRTGSLTLTGNISGSGTLTKNGSGTLVLSGTNSYSGATTINTGILQIGAGGTTGNLSTSSTITNNAGLVFNRSDNITQGTHFANNIVGSGTLTQNGSGSLRLYENSYTGGTFLNSGSIRVSHQNGLGTGNLTQTGGTLRIDGVGAISNNMTLTNLQVFGTANLTGLISVNSDATFQVLNPNTLTISSTISGAGGVTWDETSGEGRAILLGANTYLGATRLIETAILQLGNGGTTGSLSTSSTITNNGTLIFNRSDTVTQGTHFSNNIGGTGSLTQNGSGTLALNTANSYSGATTINTGIIRASNNTALGTTAGGVTVANGAALELIGGITIGAEALNLSGTGNGGANGALRNISGDNTYGGAITLAAATRINSDAGLLTLSGAIGGAGQNLTIGGAGNTAISNVIGTTTGTLTKDGAGTLTLSGANTFSGGITLSAGTLRLQNASAAGSGTLTQASAASLLAIDTTGTISNTMSLYNVLAQQSATLNGSITVNNATFDVESGDTLTLSGGVGGTGGVTKNGTGTLVLSGSNTYSGNTTVNAGILNAANANALGTNATVRVNGGSLLVSADDAINGKDIFLNSTATGNGTAASLVFSGTYNGTAGDLTLSQDSIIDLGEGSVHVHFADLAMGLYNLSIYNWTGTTLWGGGDGNNTDQFYIDRTLTESELNKISFYSGIGSNTFLGTAYQLSGGSFNNQVIPVPEPETYATAVLLLIGAGLYLHRRRKAARA